MNCNQTRTLLAPWLDDELDARATAEIEAHLHACARCHSRFTAEERVGLLIAERLRDESMPEAVWERLTARVGRHSVPRWPWMAAAAALLLVALALNWMQHPQPPELILREVAAHQASAPSYVAGAQVADVMAPITAFLSARDTTWSPPQPGKQDGHDLEWVGAETSMLDGHETLSMRLLCCGEATTIFVLDAATVAEFPAELAATINKGDTLRNSLDGVIAKTFRDGGVLVSVVSEHDTNVGRRSSG